MPFLNDSEPCSLNLDTPAGIAPKQQSVGAGGMAVEVALCNE
jgi:hypothetical protein